MAEVRRNEAAHRFELWDEGELVGVAVFHDRGGRRIFVHTEIGDDHEGKGYGGQLARGALDQTGDQDMSVVPLCPFIAGWLERHDDYQGMIDQDTLAALTG